MSGGKAPPATGDTADAPSSAFEAAETRGILEAMLNPVIIADESCIIKKVNSATLKLFRYAEGALVGQNVSVLCDPRVAPHHDRIVERYRSTGEARIIGKPARELLARRSDGTLFPMALSVTETSINGVRSFIGSIHDLSDAHRREEVLARTAGRLNSILRAMPDPLVVANASGIIDSANAAACELFGYTVRELVGANVSVLCDPVIAPHHDGILRRYMQTGERHILGQRGRHLLARRKDGSLFPISLSVSDSSEADGDSRMFIACIHDLTDARAREMRLRTINERLREAEQVAQRATHRKSVFLANVSHEIRTPLNGILATVALMSEDAQLGPSEADKLETVRSCSSNLLKLVNELLDMSKIEADQLVLEYRRFCLRTTVKNIKRMFAVLADDAGVEVSFTVDEDVPGVIGDEARFQQVLTNLFSNAIKFSSNAARCGGSAVGRAHEKPAVRATVSLAQTGDSTDDAALTADGVIKLMVRVADSGVGIAPERINAVFNEYEQASSSTTRLFGGTGLGLSICRRIVELLGGHIWVESEVGVGSTFIFTCMLATNDRGVKALQLATATGPVSPTPALTDPCSFERELEAAMADFSDERRAYLVDTDDFSYRPHKLSLELTRGTSPESSSTRSAIRKPPERGCAEPLVESPDSSRRSAKHETPASAGGFNMRDSPAQLSRCPVLSGRRAPDLSLTPRLQPRYVPSGGAASTERPSSTPPLAESEMRDVRILIVDDVALNRKVLERCLRVFGCQLYGASDGEEALELTKRRAFHIVLTDLHMGALDGLGLARAIHAHYNDEGGSSTRCARPAIVGVTSDVAEKTRVACIAAGMDDVLTKPIDIGTVRDAVQRFAATVVAQQRKLRAAAETRPQKTCGGGGTEAWAGGGEVE